MQLSNFRDALEVALAEYDADTVIIFACYSGTRAGNAVEKAKELGFVNVYNAGNINDLL